MRITQTSQKKAAVLVIDDDKNQLKTLSDILELEELHPICCRNGQEALNACKEQEVNVAILDLKLPDIDGFDLLKKLKQQNPKIKAIVYTGHASLESAMIAINEEAFAYVRKMGSIEELVTHVHRAFHTHLTLYSEKLGQEVQKRTAELIKTNQVLKKEIAERKRVEAALRDSEAKLKSIFRAAPTGIVLVSNRVFKYVNDRFCEMVGYSCQELIGKNARMIHAYQEEFERVSNEIYQQLQEFGTGEVETQYKRKDGVIIDVVISSAAIAPDDLSDGITFTALDITERKLAEAALRESEEKYRGLFHKSNDGIFLHDLSGNIIDVNQKVLTLFGYERAEILDTKISRLHPATALSASKAAFEKVSKDGFAKFEVEFRKKDGDVIPTEVSANLFNLGGKKVVQGIVRDISERKRLQNELARAQRLETAGRVAGQIAHDFNNLLSPLSAYPSLIREELPEDHSVLKMVDEIEFAANKIAEINQQLLALGRRGHYKMEPIDLNQLIQKVVLSQNLPNELVVHQEFSSNLFLIKCGSAQMTRALINLISNAREAMQDGGILTLCSENVYLDEPLKGYKTIKPGEYVKLTISDTGDGIEFEILDKIFDPFFTTKKMDKARGSGLGLSVVHGIVEDHKGYITVESVPGLGATFSLYFPSVREDEIAVKVEKAKQGSERILIVDDDPVQRRVANQILERLGYNTKTVASGEKAISFMKNHPQDLLVLDMVMDGIDGTETYKQILDFQPEQRAIILSGYAMSQRVEEALRMGAGAFVTKPITLKALATAVRNELDRKSRK